MERANGVTTRYDFDDQGNLTLLDHQVYGTSLRSYAYHYDKNGMRDSLTEYDGSGYYTHAYEYDPLYQITSATHPNYPQRPTESFAYDAVGNWLTDGSVHNGLNQLVEDNDCLYEYDADGNMTLKVDKATSDSTHYTWSIENKLVMVRMSDGDIVEYVYGPLGRRLAKVVNGVRTEYRYDGEDLIIEMNEDDSILAHYTFGPGIDQPLLMHRNEKEYYYLADGLGSITGITDSVGDVVQEYRYSAFGEMLEVVGDSVENRFTYTGREWDEEVGLYYYRKRFYDPTIGRFISEDPMGLLAGDLNYFRYVRNNPINWVDPTGGQQSYGPYNKIRPGTEDPSYNCMAYGVNSPKWEQAPDPKTVPPKFGCKKVSCKKSAGCECNEHKVIIDEDSGDARN